MIGVLRFSKGCFFDDSIPYSFFNRVSAKTFPCKFMCLTMGIMPLTMRTSGFIVFTFFRRETTIKKRFIAMCSNDRLFYLCKGWFLYYKASEFSPESNWMGVMCVGICQKGQCVKFTNSICISCICSKTKFNKGNI